jgi:ubiquinone/menaquinone biosynthesis C-methylase UbiE
MHRDLLFQQDITHSVRRAYAAIPTGAGKAAAQRLYSADELGPGGRAIGLDMLAEMSDRAELHAHQAGVDAWTEFLQGQMEAIPLPDGSIDVVISNGVLNLSARKSRALAEIGRVLRPGGRLCVADLTVNDDLPPRVLGS